MKRKNQNERGAAILILLVVATALFLLLSVALQGFFVSEKLNREMKNELNQRAEKIALIVYGTGNIDGTKDTMDK